MPRFYVEGISSSGSRETVIVEMDSEKQAREIALSRKLLSTVSSIRLTPEGLATYVKEVSDSAGKARVARLVASSLAVAIQKRKSGDLTPRTLRKIELDPTTVSRPSSAPTQATPKPAASSRTLAARVSPSQGLPKRPSCRLHERARDCVDHAESRFAVTHRGALLALPDRMESPSAAPRGETAPRRIT